MARPKISHRWRLTLNTGAVSGLLLGILFFFASFGYNRFELTEALRELKPAVGQVIADLHEQNPQPDLAEVTNPNPSLSIAIFRQDGTLINQAGPLLLSPAVQDGIQRIAATEAVGWHQQYKGIIVVATLDWQRRSMSVRRLTFTLAALWPVLVAIVSMATWVAARATFRPLESLTAQAASFSGTDLSRRLVPQDDLEFGSLAQNLNALLDRIEQTARREEQFAADAAHELRTPLTILQGQIETSLLRPRSKEEYLQTMGIALREVKRLSRLVEVLLRSANAETTVATYFDLTVMVQATHARWLDRFESQGVHLESMPPETAVSAQILPEEIGTVLDNLLENALRHSPLGTTCQISLKQTPQEVVISVQDEGEGLESGQEEIIFERFVRGDNSRNRTLGGFGIGLAVSKRIIEGRKGTLTAFNRPEGGAQFDIRLPTSG